MLAVARPGENTAHAISKLRERLVRKKLAPAGIWTIETGSQFAGLHLNILAPASHLQAISQNTAYAEIVRTSSRAAAAYISKRTGMPSIQQYDGRLLGEWGTIAQHIMADTNTAAAAPQAALAELALMTETERLEKAQGWFRVPGGYVKGTPMPIERTKEEYAEIAKRHLPRLYAITRPTSL